MERDILTEKRLVKAYLDEGVSLSQIWYTIDANWWNKWKKFVNYNSEEQTVIEHESPGAINNINLIEKNRFRESSLKEFDYEIVPEKVWLLLVEKYGCVQSDAVMFQRFVVKQDDVLCVDISPLRLTFKIYGDSGDSSEVEASFSCGTQFTEIDKFVQKSFNIPEGAVFQFIQETDSNANPRVVHFDADTTLFDAGINRNQRLFVDVKSSNGEFAFRDTRPSYVNSNGAVKGGSSSMIVSSLSSNTPFSKNDDVVNESRFTQGVCGLSNLGNTCFMNSAIQCISNVYPITSYFLRNSWQSDLNKDNPLGMEGRIATAYANLIKEMWSGKVPYALPREFKYEVAQFAPQFCGYSQHDSQELMMFLLDGLHEDLNRITQKPYIEQKNCTNQPDEIVAEENWNYHLKRNNSIIVDYFHGQLKSRVVCPKCNFVSVTFDPFASLSLPLRHYYYQSVIVFPVDPASPITELSILIYKNTSVEDLKNLVEKEVKWNKKNQLTVVVVTKFKITRYLKDTEYLSNTHMDDHIVIYELNPLQPDHYYIDVSFKEKSKNYYCSLPFIVQIHKKLNWQSFLSVIKSQWSRFLVDSIFSGDFDPLGECTDKIDFIDNQSLTEDITDNSDFEKSESISNSSIDSSKVGNNPFENIFSVILRETSSTSTNDHEINPLSRNRPLKSGADQHIVIEWLPENYHSYSKEPAITKISCKQTSPKLTIIDCLKQFLCEEYLGEKDLWFCPKCKKNMAASKKLDIWRLPKVLVLHLKRFKTTSLFGDKINSEVHFPIKNLDLSQYVPKIENVNDCIYDLVAVSNHVGCLAGGHYFAFAKNYLDSRWYKFDDSNTSCVDESEIVTKSAYVLVYVSRSGNIDYALTGRSSSDHSTCRDMMQIDINSPE